MGVHSLFSLFKRRQAAELNDTADPATPPSPPPKPPFGPMLAFLDKYSPADLEAPAKMGGGEQIDSNTMTFPYYILTPAQEAFRDAACQWSVYGDWIAWMGTELGKDLANGSPGSVERASPEDLAQLLTVMLRSDRFCEGAFAGYCERGVAGRILLRIKELHAQEQGGEMI